MHQHFLHIGAMQAVGRLIEAKLDAACDPIAAQCRQYDSLPGLYIAFNSKPEIFCNLRIERRKKANRSAIVHGIGEQHDQFGAHGMDLVSS